METTYKGQRYEFVETRPIQRRDGSASTANVWRSNCAECGAEFSVSVETFSLGRTPSRRCEAHKQPGITVKRKGRHDGRP